MNDLRRLIDRADGLLERMERLLPAQAGAPDWEAHAFRWRSTQSNGWLQAVTEPQRLPLADLCCLEPQKAEIVRNTGQFLLLIYATSNRRHLLPEPQRENREARAVDGEIHPGEGIEEKISLSDRFGLWLSFYPFTQDQYLHTVRHWLDRFGIASPGSAAVERAALQWAQHRGSRSGRAAWQFARDWAGRHGA